MRAWRLGAAWLLLVCAAAGSDPVLIPQIDGDFCPSYKGASQMHAANRPFRRDGANELRRPEADFLRDGIYELRASCQGLHYRMLYFFAGRAIVVGEVPPREIDLAKERKKNVE